MAGEFALVERLETSAARWDLDCAIPAGARSLLDVGCGAGRGFAALRDRGVRVVGVDHDQDVLEAARDVLDDVVALDLDAAEWPLQFTGAFDVVAFADCLEHLRDPWRVLRSARRLWCSASVA